MGETNIEIAIAEIKADTGFIKREMSETRTEVKNASSAIIGLQHQIKDIEQIRAEIDRMRDDVTDLKMKIVRYSTAASIVAVVVGWVGNGYVTQTVKDSVSKPTVSIASPTGK
ncbi:hypothetical protein GAY30_07260 [Azospirillum brasilense]|nr:hypothetical protein [Azospirillum brasilense]NUB24703.1 hypothetical protein [Azospirillum brasilense]NUB30693.1 hypothetical protein [Azospirillum brasilense]RIW08302.1 hypothetical protein D2T81_00905 [Azospirillum brasilense]